MRTSFDKLSDIIVRLQPGYVKIFLTILSFVLLIVTNSPGTPGDVGGMY